MSKFLTNLFLIFFLLINTAYAEKQYPFAIPNLDVSSYALMDANTGAIIAGKDLDKRVEPES